MRSSGRSVIRSIVYRPIIPPGALGINLQSGRIGVRMADIFDKEDRYTMRVRISSIENLISKDPGRRNIFPLIRRDHLRLAALSLLKAERVLIVSGYPIKKAGAGETDGPPGSWAFGEALKKLGIPYAYLTDKINTPLFKALGAEPLYRWDPDLLKKESFSHLVAIERPGRARDGRYYNMAGVDISDVIEPLDTLFLDAEAKGVTTIGIGDGGNEIGMGSLFQGVSRVVRHGNRIASTVLTDYVVVAGVSNWGAYGLIGALSVLAGRDLLPSVDQVVHSVEKIVQAGAVDGVNGESQITVDGLPLSDSLDILQDIRWHLVPSPLESVAGRSAGVVGAGQSGRAAARLLKMHGAKVRLSDHGNIARPRGPERLCSGRSGNTQRTFWRTRISLCSAPGSPPKCLLIQQLREKGIPVMSELEAAYQLGRPELIAVTGSAGKSSTVRALEALFSSRGRRIPWGGNKGLPLSQLIMEEGEGSRINLAVSSYQLESIIRFRPRIAVMLNIKEHHLERHADVEETLRIKSRIFMNHGAEDFLIVNKDDPHLEGLSEKHWGETLFVASTDPNAPGARGSKATGFACGCIRTTSKTWDRLRTRIRKTS